MLTSCVRLVVLSVSICLLAAACRISQDDIEKWKDTAKGPGKLVAVIGADKYPIALRTQAALALIEMDRQDVDGSAELQKAIHKLNESTRYEIVEQLTVGLSALMRGEGAAKKAADDKSTDPLSPMQIRAKDAAYLLLAQADAETKKKLTDAVVSWYAEDFNGRSLAGSYTAEQVIRALGAPAAEKLIDGLSEKIPQQALVKSAELISQIGNAEGKLRAANRLIEIERTMEGPAFLDWLKGEIRNQLKGSGVGADGKPIKVDENRVKNGAQLTRNTFIMQGALSALKHFADLPPVAKRLLDIAEQSGDSDEMVERRRAALLALQGKANKTELKRILALALGDKVPVAVKDEAFDRLGEIGSPDIVPSLWPLITNAKDDRIRWRAGELILLVGGKDVVPEFLGRLPSDKDAKFSSGELTGYATRLSQMTQAPVRLIHDKLRSEKWAERVIALQFIARKGSVADVSLVEPLVSDATLVQGEGWQKDTTVGMVAKEIIETLKQRTDKPTTAGG